ncbi:stage III sporulation protein AE [Clostridium sp. UBA4548]|uniref:stage III sporulation protein AE n=1 Tax=Clostridium sp. UBA4548 TaxID=1946361 RepID=UPI0025B9D208|nr:stage III sporulation protein AE [Clostridium sp. UBA4548]
MKKILLILMMILWIPLNVQASEEIKIDQEQMNKVNGLYNYISNMQNEYDLLRDMSPKEFVEAYMKNGQGSLQEKKITKIALSYIFKEVVASFKIIGGLIIIAVVCALLNNLQSAFSNESLSNIAYFACFAVMITIIAKGFYVGVDLVHDVILDISNFMAALMPVLIALLASVGSFTEAIVMDPIIMAACSIGANLYSTIIIPIICMSFVLEFVNNISDGYNIDKLTALLRKCALWSQGIILTIFVGIITIRGITSSSLDLVTTKTAKYAVDSFIPVVGKTLSDAFATVASYTMLLKSSVSVLGVLVLIGIVLVPIIKIVTMAFMYKLTAALLQPVSDKKVTAVIDSAGSSLILLGSCLISVTIMFFIMITIIATTGKGLILA